MIDLTRSENDPDITIDVMLSIWKVIFQKTPKLLTSLAPDGWDKSIFKKLIDRSFIRLEEKDRNPTLDLFRLIAQGMIDLTKFSRFYIQEEDLFYSFDEQIINESTSFGRINIRTKHSYHCLV